MGAELARKGMRRHAQQGSNGLAVNRRKKAWPGHTRTRARVAAHTPHARTAQHQSAQAARASTKRHHGKERLMTKSREHTKGKVAGTKEIKEAERRHTQPLQRKRKEPETPRAPHPDPALLHPATHHLEPLHLLPDGGVVEGQKAKMKATMRQWMLVIGTTSTCHGWR